ncbi:MAG: hypothetical protein ACK5A0_15035 [Polaromonas sp.]
MTSPIDALKLKNCKASKMDLIDLSGKAAQAMTAGDSAKAKINVWGAVKARVPDQPGNYFRAGAAAHG